MGCKNNSNSNVNQNVSSISTSKIKKSSSNLNINSSFSKGNSKKKGEVEKSMIIYNKDNPFESKRDNLLTGQDCRSNEVNSLRKQANEYYTEMN